MDRRAFLAAAAAAPFALAAPPAAARTAGGTPLALVTADLESRVVAWPLASGRPRAIPTPAGPRSIETVGAGRLALAAHTSAGAVSLIDVATLRVRRVLSDFAEPRYTAAAPDGLHAYVTDAARGELVTVDLRRGRVVHRTWVGARARHLGLDPGSMTLWTALGFSAAELAVVDVSRPERPRLVGRVRPPFPAHDVVFAPGGEHVWVSSGSERRLAIFDAATRRPLELLAAGRPPQHLTFAGAAAHVTSDDELRVHRPRDGRLLRATPLPEGSYNVTSGFGLVFTPSLERGTLTVLDERGHPLERPRLARSAHDACFVVSA